MVVRFALPTTMSVVQLRCAPQYMGLDQYGASSTAFYYNPNVLGQHALMTSRAPVWWSCTHVGQHATKMTFRNES